MKVKLLRDWKNKRSEKVINVSEKVAQQLQDDGIGIIIISQFKYRNRMATNFTRK